MKSLRIPMMTSRRADTTTAVRLPGWWLIVDIYLLVAVLLVVAGSALEI